MGKTLRIAGTIGESIVDGPGFRYVIFTQGCPHHCPGCHNPETHDFAGGTEIDSDVLVQATRVSRSWRRPTHGCGSFWAG